MSLSRDDDFDVSLDGFFLGLSFGFEARSDGFSLSSVFVSALRSSGLTFFFPGAERRRAIGCLGVLVVFGSFIGVGSASATDS